MKLQVKRAFENLYFCHQKNNKKTSNLCMKFSSTFNTSVEMCLYPLFQDRRRKFFWRMSQPSGQDQKNGEQTTLALQNLLRGYIFSYLHGHLQRLICPEYFLNFNSNLYVPPWLRKWDHHFLEQNFYCAQTRKIQNFYLWITCEALVCLLSKT